MVLKVFFSGLESFPRDVCKVFSTKCTPLLNQSRFSMFILSWGCTSCWVCTKFLVFWHHCWSHINFSPVCHVGIPGLHQVGWYEGGWHHRWPHHIRKLFLNSLPSKAAALSAKLHNSSTKTPIVSASGSLSLSWPSSSQFFWKTRKSLFPQARRAWIGSFSPFYHLSLRQKSVSDVTDRFPQTSIQMVGDHCYAIEFWKLEQFILIIWKSKRIENLWQSDRPWWQWPDYCFQWILLLIIFTVSLMGKFHTDPLFPLYCICTCDKHQTNLNLDQSLSR